MGTAIVLLGTIAAGMAGTAAMYRLVQNFQPGKQKVRKDLAAMQEELKPVIPELIPIKKDELELLSRNQINESRKKRVTTKGKGVFTSIYQEPMIAWSMRKYLGSERNSLVYARTANHEFFLRSKSKETTISVDNQVALRLMKDGKMLDGRGKKVVGYLYQESESDPQIAVYVGRKEVAAIQHIPETTNPQPRVFNYVSDVDPGEQLALLAMTIAYLTKDLP